MVLPFSFLVVATAVVGLAIGSFLNVVVHRVPAGVSIARPGSSCPGCHAPIGTRDNIPLLSWLLLHGRCRHCAASISIRYPIIEGLTAALFVLAALRLGWSPTLPAILAFFAGLVALAACDLEHYLLPRKIVYPTGIAAGGFLVMAAVIDGRWQRLGVALACSVVAFGVFFAINAANPAWLGFGDVRLMAVIGLVLGWFGPLYLLAALLVANGIGLVVIAALIATGRAQRSTPVPYGVFLAAGAVAALFFGEPLSHLLLIRR